MILDTVLCTPPRLVVVSIHNNVFVIIVIKQVVPIIGEVISVEHKLHIGIRLVHDIPDISVELVQSIPWSWTPRLVNWFKSVHSWVVTPSIHQLLNVIKSPIDIVIVDRVILLG